MHYTVYSSHFSITPAMYDAIEAHIVGYFRARPDLQVRKMAISLSSINTITQRGKDLFQCSIQLGGGYWTHLCVVARESDLYRAIDLAGERLRRKLNKTREKRREKSLRTYRREAGDAWNSKE